jgi:dTDP-4-amino-4,6-dideoxygalactose transaminase
MRLFEKSFTQQEPLPADAISAALEVMHSGRLHRYNTDEGETSEVSQFETEFAAYMDVPYCLACASCGYALHIALRSVGVKPGEKVLCNSFTLSPVPGAIHNAGGIPVFVETTAHYTIDLAHLRALATAEDIRYLMLSHMRGHICDMDELDSICQENGITYVEDCAHTMGASWNGRKIGSYGAVACFSTQTYKHLNSGEGGILTTNDDQIMARAIIHSGSYMLYGRHTAAPEEAVFDQIKLETPNYSGRMDNLRAAVLRPQLVQLDTNCDRWNSLYGVLKSRLGHVEGLALPDRPEKEQYVGSSIQFSLPSFSEMDIKKFIEICGEQGIEIKWFGASEPIAFTSRYDSWNYIKDTADLPHTLTILATLCDMRVPLTFNTEDCALIADIISEVVAEIKQI